MRLRIGKRAPTQIWEGSMSEQIFVVVVNGDGQHSLVPEGNTIPAGWTSVGWAGTHAAALEHMASLTPPSQEFLDFQQRMRESGERFRAQEKAKEEERLRRLEEIRRERGQ
jgi:uncharacterized protein YbdZ (MbtH family)